MSCGFQANVSENINKKNKSKPQQYNSKANGFSTRKKQENKYFKHLLPFLSLKLEFQRKNSC